MIPFKDVELRNPLFLRKSNGSAFENMELFNLLILGQKAWVELGKDNSLIFVKKARLEYHCPELSPLVHSPSFRPVSKFIEIVKTCTIR